MQKFSDVALKSYFRIPDYDDLLIKTKENEFKSLGCGWLNKPNRFCRKGARTKVGDVNDLFVNQVDILGNSRQTPNMKLNPKPKTEEEIKEVAQNIITLLHVRVITAREWNALIEGLTIFQNDILTGKED